MIPENSLRIRSNRSGLSHALTLLSVRVPKVHYFHPALLINRAYILPISPSPNVSVILHIQGEVPMMPISTFGSGAAPIVWMPKRNLSR
jgi:hypothetical protein